MSASTISGTISLVVLSGPAVGPPHLLPPGRYVVGRASSADVRLDDPAVESHHLLVDVDDEGRAVALQLAGRCPVLVDDRPVDGRSVLLDGQRIVIGATCVRIDTSVSSTSHVEPEPESTPIGAAPIAPAPIAPAPIDAAPLAASAEQTTIVRSPRAVPALTLPAIEPFEVIEPPPPGGHPGMLVGSLVGVLGGFVLGLVTGSPLMLVMGIIAASVSWSTWAVGRARRTFALRRIRRRRVEAAETARVLVADVAASVRAHHERCHPSVAERLALTPGDGLWERRRTHGDAFVVSLGRGDLDHQMPIDPEQLPGDCGALLDAAATLADVEIPADLDRHERHVVAVSGPGAHGVGRAVLLQLAMTTGPADWTLRAVLTDPSAHGWMTLLPHARRADAGVTVVAASDLAGTDALVAALDEADEIDDRRVVLVCDDPSLLTIRGGAVRRLLDGARPVTVILLDESGGALPAVCRSVLRLCAGGSGRWIADLDDAGDTEALGERRLRPVSVGVTTAREVASRLARCVDPELVGATADHIPRAVTLGQLAASGLVPWTTDEILAAWAAGGVDPRPAAVLGLRREPGSTAGTDDVVEIDLVRDGPHGLIGGTTGSGKSELLRTLVVSLAARTDPALLSFVLIDYKGGATFDACAALPHTAGVVTDLDEGSAARALVSLDAEIRRRERILREVGAADLAAARAGPTDVDLPRLVVVIDEFAALAKELPGFLAALVDVAQRGRSLGIHLLLATQRPAGVIDDAIRANTDLRIALRLNDATDALDVVGDRLPVGFPRSSPGRVAVRFGAAELLAFQSASCTVGPSDSPTDLETLVERIAAAARRTGFAGAHRPWLPPLDDPSVPEPEPGAVGWIDDPAGQRRQPLRWSGTAHLALVGAIGSGTTSTLLALAAEAEVVHLIDGRGDRSLDVLDRAGHCSGVIGVDDHERVDRLLRRLCHTIDQRRAGRSAEGDVTEVLMIDGFEVVRRSLDEPDRIDPDGGSSPSARLRRILAEGPSVGVVVVAVIEPESGGASLARFGERWLFHVADPTVAAMLGVPLGSIPPPVPGRIIVAASGLEARIWPLPDDRFDSDVDDSREGGRTQGARAVARIERLGEQVTLASLGGPVSVSASVSGAHLVIGRRFDDLAPATIEWTPGDAVVIAGPRRSGRSTLLGHLVRSWQTEHPDGEVVVVSAVDGVAGSAGLATLAEAAERLAEPPSGSVGPLVVVDDADRVEDRGGVLAGLLSGARAGTVTMLLAGRADSLRSYEHWAAAARRRRSGFVMAATSELDGDVLGVVPPRRCPVRPRPGLVWMIADDDCTLVQTLAPPPP